MLLSFNTLQFLCIHLNSLFSVSIFTASSFSLADCTLTRTNTWVIHTYRNTLASSLTCSHTHANWHTASFEYCTAYTHATHMWKCPQDTAFLILTLAVVGSSWPPENELWLSIFTPWTAEDYNGTLFFCFASGGQPTLLFMWYCWQAYLRHFIVEFWLCWTTAWCLRSVSEAAKVMCGVKFKDLTRNSNNDNSLDLYSAFQEIQGYIRPFFLKSQKPKALVSRWHFKCFLSVLQNSGRNMLQRVGATVLEALSQRTTAWCEGMERRTLTCEHRVWDGV